MSSNVKQATAAGMVPPPRVPPPPSHRQAARDKRTVMPDYRTMEPALAVLAAFDTLPPAA